MIIGKITDFPSVTFDLICKSFLNHDDSFHASFRFSTRRSECQRILQDLPRRVKRFSIIFKLRQVKFSLLEALYKIINRSIHFLSPLYKTLKLTVLPSTDRDEAFGIL